MDGHALEIDDNSFEIAGSQFGVMLFPDMPKGIGEMARVVKPGGRVLMNVYGDPHKIEFLGFFVRAIQSVRPDFTGPPMDPPPLPFQLQDPGTLGKQLAAAGLRNVKVETISEDGPLAKRCGVAGVEQSDRRWCSEGEDHECRRAVIQQALENSSASGPWQQRHPDQPHQYRHWHEVSAGHLHAPDLRQFTISRPDDSAHTSSRRFW
jgi:SAM-dependent methyltransferase